MPLRVALIGHGAIGEHVAAQLLAGHVPGAELAAVLVRTPRDGLGGLLTADADAFFGADWDLCVEAAGAPAVVEYAARVLRSGRRLLLVSIGALCDDALRAELEGLCASPAQLLLAAGAMPGMDWMSAASLDHVDELAVTQTKHPRGWAGTPAESALRGRLRRDRDTSRRAVL